MLNVIMLSVTFFIVMLNVIMLGVVKLNAVMLSVVAPMSNAYCFSGIPPYPCYKANQSIQGNSIPGTEGSLPNQFQTQATRKVSLPIFLF
jgi:hypothetical protein